MVARTLLDANQLRCSKPGYDVLTATPSQLNFDSTSQAMGVYMSGTVNPSGPISSITFPSLGFVPFVMVQAYDSSTGLWLAQYFIDDLGGIIYNAQAGIKFSVSMTSIAVNYLMNSSPRYWHYTIFYTPA